MKFLDILEYAFSDYTSNKFKTMMSSLGIIIGVMAIIVMLTLGNGLSAGVSKQFGDLALDTMVVAPGSISLSGPQSTVQKPAATFTDRDITLIASTPGVIEVNPRMSTSASGTFNGENRSLTINGILPQYDKSLASNVHSGRFLSQNDKYSVVIGDSVYNGTFSKLVRVGSYITLTNPYTGASQQYMVVGILKEMNTSMLTGNPNSEVYVTKDGLSAISNVNTYSYITVRADNVQDADKVASSVTDALNRLHRNEAFTVITQKAFSTAIQSIFSLITEVLAGIAAVSLVVGGIGIMNVMMLTVKERVKEIGLMKAVGATTTDVRLIFLAESAMLGFISGVIGVLLAAIISAIVGSIVGFPMNVSWDTALLGVGFGLLITTVFGVYPANQASRLDPIEALRTE